MFAVVAATVVGLTPAPYDLLTAHADLTAPVGSPLAAERTPRARVAALLVLTRLPDDLLFAKHRGNAFRQLLDKLSNEPV